MKFSRPHTFHLIDGNGLTHMSPYWSTGTRVCLAVIEPKACGNGSVHNLLYALAFLYNLM